jgi:hypothetical protein
MRKIMNEEPYTESNDGFKARMHRKHTKHQINSAKSRREKELWKSRQKDVNPND